jgi:hypothetical protein
MPMKIDNCLGEYFQITFFLVAEKIKGDKSFWKPFLDSLPTSNDTLYTILDKEVKIES